MADILVQKDENTLVPKLGISATERLAWARDFTIYDIQANGLKSAPFGPLVDPRKGATVKDSDYGGGALRYVTNPAALKPAAAALLGAVATEFYIGGNGDSMFMFGGDNLTLPNSDTVAELHGVLACTRRYLNSALGTPDGGQWISAEASVADTRVANTGTTPVNQFGPYNSFNSAGNVITQRRAQSLSGAAQNITFTVVGRYLDVEIWENAGSYVGTATWTVDGGGGGTINSNGGGGATDLYRTVRLDLVTDAAHVVSITWATLSVLITGATVTRGSGVVTRRFAYGGSKASTWAGLTAKQIRTSFNTVPTHLQLIRISYNDWNNQIPDALTISAFQGYVQTLINAALLNASNKAILLMADPPSSTADTKPIKYAEFDAVLKAMAVVGTKVAFLDLTAAVCSSYDARNGMGYTTDFIHGSKTGNGAEGRVIANAMLDPWLLLA